MSENLKCQVAGVVELIQWFLATGRQRLALFLAFFNSILALNLPALGYMVPGMFYILLELRVITEF